MSNNNNSSSGGIGVVGLLGVLFIGLKLGHVIDWSWWWVTAPFWGGLVLVVGFVVVVFLGMIVVETMKALTGGK